MKKIIILISTIFLIAIIAISIYHFTNNSYITSEEAKKIAIKDVSNRDGEYIFHSIEFGETDGIYIYTLSFRDQINLYTYKINAKSKKIIHSKEEPLVNDNNYMDESTILEIVFNHANLEKNKCNLLSNLVTLEDGIPFYNTIFYHSNLRYEYKINALTGSIISVIKLNENATE